MNTNDKNGDMKIKFPILAVFSDNFNAVSQQTKVIPISNAPIYKEPSTPGNPTFISENRKQETKMNGTPKRKFKNNPKVASTVLLVL